MKEENFLQFKDLQEELEHEYYKFKQLVLATSREGIFNRADEIVIKKSIAEAIMKYEFSIEEKNRLLHKESIIDSVYSCITDSLVDYQDINQAIKKILNEN